MNVTQEQVQPISADPAEPNAVPRPDRAGGPRLRIAQVAGPFEPCRPRATEAPNESSMHS